MKWRLFFFIQLIGQFIVGAVVSYESIVSPSAATLAQLRQVYWLIIAISAVLYFGEIMDKRKSE